MLSNYLDKIIITFLLIILLCNIRRIMDDNVNQKFIQNMNCLEQYHNQNNQFQISFCLQDVKGQQQLYIQFYNRFNFRSYKLKIDKQFIYNHKEVNYVFAEPKQIHQQFKNNFHQININQNALIIRYNFIIGNIKNFLDFKFQQIQQNQIEVLIKEINKSRKIIQQTQKKYAFERQKNEQQIRQLKQELTANMARINNQTMFGVEMFLNAIIKDFDIYKQEQRNQTIRLALTNQMMLKKTNIADVINPIDNLDHAFYSAYMIQKSKYLIQKLMISLRGYHNFIFSPQIQRQTIKTFKFRLISNDTDLMIGFCTKNVFQVYGYHNYYHPEAMYFYPRDLEVYMKEVSEIIKEIPKNYESGKGSLIRLTIDTIKWQVNWTIDDYNTISRQIPQKMRNQSIYLALSLRNQGNSIEVQI